MMMRSVSVIMSYIFRVLFVVSFSGFGNVTSLGINYGQLGSNLPHPEKVVTLLKSLRITKTRIYDTNPIILQSFANTGIEVIVTVENNMMATLSDPLQALEWVNTHIAPYYPATKITGIAVGNEVFSDPDSSLMLQVVPAMISIHQSLVQLGLNTFIHISTPNSLAVLSCSYPPSAGTFKPELTSIMVQFLLFLYDTNSPFWINAYPYFTYKDDPSHISLDYVLMNSNTAGMVDPFTNLHYDNMLHAQVDAVIFAMNRLGFKGIDVKVSETGWPSNGDPDEAGATLENAEMYTRNMFKRHLLRNEGTPLRPQNRLDVYLFALFNENMKPGVGSERHYGLYHPDGTLAYNVGMSTLLSSSTFVSSTSSDPGSELVENMASPAPMLDGFPTIFLIKSIIGIEEKILKPSAI